MTRIKSTLLFIVLAVLVFPALQKCFHFITPAPLEGYFQPSPRPDFSLASLCSGEFQQTMSPHIERTTGFHENFVRIFNQADFTFFSIPHAAKIIIGKNNLLQADSHVDAYLGRDFAGKRFLDDKIERIRYLQDYLRQEKGILLLVVLAPGKGFYYPESIPARYLERKKSTTNQDYFASGLEKNGINLIDFNRWFLGMKDTSRQVLYPKTGIHWSTFGATLCADSLIRYLESALHRRLPHPGVEKWVTMQRADKEDDDMDRVLNLLWKIPVPPMTYPVFRFNAADTTRKPAVLFISDSFYWNWQHTGIIRNTFSRGDMWYYDKEVYPAPAGGPLNTAEVGLDSAISRQEVVILMQTNAGYGNIGYGFVDRAYEYYYRGMTPVKRIEANYRANPALMDIMRKKAADQHLPVESVLYTDAVFLYNTELKRLSKYN